MRKFILSMLAVLIVLLGVFSPAFAQGSDEPYGDDKQIPKCSDMVEFQIPGKASGSACRVPVVSVGISADNTILSLYRRGWTHEWTSESHSDLWEDSIRVRAYLYLKTGTGWQLDGNCDDPTYGHHAACSTGPVLHGEFRQDGYHYFQKSGYVPQSFQTRDEWTN